MKNERQVEKNQPREFHPASPEPNQISSNLLSLQTEQLYI